MKDKLYSIQMLRAVACFSVILSHAIVKVYRTESVDFPDFLGDRIAFTVIGHFGVDLFFVISGFIMYLIHAKDFGDITKLPKFAYSRVVRVVPIYWLLTTIALIGLWFKPDLFTFREGIESHWVLGSYFFIPTETSYGLVTPIIGVGWTLNYEMFFYFSFALLIISTSRYSLAFLFLVFLTLVFFGGSWNKHDTDGLYTLVTSPLILEFLLGVVVGILFKKYRQELSVIRYLNILVACVVLAYSATVIPRSYLDRLFLWGIPSALLLLGCLYIRFDPKSSTLKNIVVKFGDASYSAYLVQVFSLPLFTIIGLYLGIENYFLLFLFITLTTVLSSFLFFYVVEKPLTRFLNGKFKHYFVKEKKHNES